MINNIFMSENVKVVINPKKREMEVAEDHAEDCWEKKKCYVMSSMKYFIDEVHCGDLPSTSAGVLAI